MESIKELYKICMGRMGEDKLKYENKLLYIKYVTRPISFLITKPFLILGISANQTSFIGIFVILLSFVFMSLGSYWNMIIGAILAQVWLILDAVDGNIARYHGSKKIGPFIDSLGADIAYVAIFLSAGIAAYNSSNYLFNFFNPVIFVVCGAIASLSKILTRYTKNKFNQFIASVQKTEIFDKEEIKSKTIKSVSTSKIREVAKFISFNFSNQAAYLLPLFLIFTIFSMMDIFIVFQAVLLFLIYIATIIEFLLIAKEKKYFNL